MLRLEILVFVWWFGISLGAVILAALIAVPLYIRAGKHYKEAVAKAEAQKKERDERRKNGGYDPLYDYYPSYYVRDREDYAGNWTGVVGMIGAISAVFAALILAFMLIPYNPTYWSYKEISGEIQSVSNTFVEGTGDLTWGGQVIKLEDQSVVVEDRRIVDYEVGDSVRLNCLPTWVYGASDRLYCNIIND